MKETRHEISSKQLCTFLFSVQIGIGLLTIPTVLAQKTDHDGWISLVIAGFLSLFAYWILVVYLQRFKDKSIYEINTVLYGKHGGLALNCLVILYLIFSAAIGIRLFEEVVEIMALRQTPPLVITVLILIPTTYMSLYGLKAVGRFSVIILGIALFIAIFLFMNKEHVNLSFLMPVGDAGIQKIISSVFDAFFAFVGFELVVVIFPYIRDKDYVLKWGIISGVLSLLVFCMVTVFTTAFFGEEMLKKLTLPLFNLSRCYKSRIFERVDLLFTMLWFPAMAISFRAYFFTGYESICRVFHIKKPSLTLFVYSVVLLLISRIPRNAVQAFGFTNTLSYATGALLCFIFLSYLLSLILKRKG